MLGLDIFIEPDNMDCLKLHLSVEVSWNYTGGGE